MSDRVVEIGDCDSEQQQQEEKRVPTAFSFCTQAPLFCRNTDVEIVTVVRQRSPGAVALFRARGTRDELFATCALPLFRQLGSFLDQLLRSPQLKLLCEGEGYWEHLLTVVAGGGIQGPKVHDARIAALCLHRGVTMLLSADRDFRGFPGLRVVNPFGPP